MHSLVPGLLDTTTIPDRIASSIKNRLVRDITTMKPVNERALALKALHKPGYPIILTNIWDLHSLNAVLSLNTEASKPVKAVGTSSWVIAETLNISDEDLNWGLNLDHVATFAPAAIAAGLPLSVDLQDGYEDAVASAVSEAIKFGACGATFSDHIYSAAHKGSTAECLYDIDKQTLRMRVTLTLAGGRECPDFAINARCDVFAVEPAPETMDPAAMEEAVRRGKAYLEAGATSVFYWGGGPTGRGLRTEEIEVLVRKLDGRVAVLLGSGEGALSVEELGALGVCRASFGPRLYQHAKAAIVDGARTILETGKLC